jgi:hypothetical protein
MSALRQKRSFPGNQLFDPEQRSQTKTVRTSDTEHQLTNPGAGVRTSRRAPFLGANQSTSTRQLFASVRLLHNKGIARPRLNFRSCGLAAIARGAPAVF